LWHYHKENKVFEEIQDKKMSSEEEDIDNEQEEQVDDDGDNDASGNAEDEEEPELEVSIRAVGRLTRSSLLDFMLA
jgi:hypothetical protein